MGCASSKATQGAVASVPPKSKVANSLPPPNPNVAVATAANIVTASSSVDQIAASDEIFKDEEVRGSVDVVPQTTFQKPHDAAQEARNEVEGNTSMDQHMDTHENEIKPIEDDVVSISQPESASGIMIGETALDANGEDVLLRIADGCNDPITEAMPPLNTNAVDEEEMVPSHMVEHPNESDKNGATDDSGSTSNPGNSLERCTGENPLTPLDDKHGDVALKLPPSEAGTIDGTIDPVPAVRVEELRASGLVEPRSEIEPRETSVAHAVVADGVVGSGENVGVGKCVVNEHDSNNKEETQAGCEASIARAAVDTVHTLAVASLPCSDPAPHGDNEQGSAITGPLISDFSEATKNRVVDETDEHRAHQVASVAPSVGDHVQQAERDTDNVHVPERDTMTSLGTPEESQVEADQSNHVDDGIVAETDTAGVSESMPSPSDIQTAEAADTETFQESSAETDRDKPSKQQVSAAVAAPTMSVSESIDRILKGNDDDSEPITELRNVTSMTRVLIPDEKRNSKPSVVDRWGLSTTMNKIKTKALSNLNGTADEPTSVGEPPKEPSEGTSESEKLAASARPMTSKATGWSSPKSVERVLLSLSEELAPPSPPSTSSSGLKSSSPPSAGKNKVARSTSGRGSDRSTKTASTSASASATPVSRELTDIERARLFAASVLAETERRAVAGPASTPTTTASSWWKQKVSSLQHELQ